MKKIKIDVWHDNLTKENLEAYFSKTVSLYNKGEYEAALKGLEKISEFDINLRISLIPQIEKCKYIKNKTQTDTDKRHFRNQAVLQYFGWINNVKYFTGIASFMFFMLLMGDTEEGTSSFNNLSEHPEYLVWAIVLAIVTYLLHKFMKKFTFSLGLIRCKYCGHYTQYINPNDPTFGFINNNNCSKCNRMYPVPNFYWDGWEGLEYMENRHSVPEKEFYEECRKLKEIFSKEYLAWKKTKAKEVKFTDEL
jgi:hypothetical protein